MLAGLAKSAWNIGAHEQDTAVTNSPRYRREASDGITLQGRRLLQASDGRTYCRLVTTVRIPLVISTLVARAVGTASRRSGKGGGTTLPGRVLNVLNPEGMARLAARLEQGSAIISATNGKTTTAAMTAAILAPRFRLAGNPAGANLSSGISTALLYARGADLGLFEVDEAALPQVTEALKPRVLCLGN